MREERFIMRSTLGVQQTVVFDLLPTQGGFFIKSSLRIAGRLPKPGACVLTPLTHENALKWINSRTHKLAQSAAAFRPVVTFEQEIEALFFGT